ncbi:phage tail sheath family protein [Anaerophilus nitritogenes]|uniref:phage tail sheath family protein n=1 Tax=Anaerophilus nitritogenes TaxID=2498136 RepID=UPI00101D05D6|nr:phage tail sheath family protein [Anaerophilus nitritogenes]
MPGGTWLTQNKVRPGVYVNFESEPTPLGTLGDRGIATMPLVLSWGVEKEIITIESGEDTVKKLGYAITESQLLLVRECLKRAKTLLLYRVNIGKKATATIEPLTVNAKHTGARGNDIKIVVQADIDVESKFDVITLVKNRIVDKQIVATVENLVSNDWVDFSGKGTLVVNAGVSLTGGEDGTSTNQDYTDYLAAIEKYEFNTMALPSTDTTLKGVFVSFIKRLRDDEGKKVQCVLENYPIADYEGIISVKNGVILADNTELTPEQATAWVAGATAGANVNQSLTYTKYDDAIDVNPRYTNTEIIKALKAGEFIFTHSNGTALVEQDINSLTSFTPKKGREFAKNRVIRVLDSINNDFLKIFSDFYIGKVDNNAEGRNLLKGECISYLEILQGISAITNFDSQTDIIVIQGTAIDSVYIKVNVQPVDAVEKIYIDVVVRATDK